MNINTDDFSPIERQIFFITQQFMSHDIDAYSSAMVAARDDFKTLEKSGSRKDLNYNYAKIEDIYNAVVPALTKNGIQIDHFRVAISDGREILATRLTHSKSKQFRQDSCWLDAEKPGNQAKGSALTYMKKYAVLNLCGLAPDEDDDGVGADGKKHSDKPSHQEQPVKQFTIVEDGTKITPNQLSSLQRMFNGNQSLQTQYANEYFNLNNLTKAEASQLIGKLK